MERKKSLLASMIMSLALLFAVLSCTEKDAQLQATQQFDVAAWRNQPEARQLALAPQQVKDFPAELKELRKSAVILSRYVVTHNGEGRLTISQADAEKQLGIPAEHYQEIADGLAASYKAYREALAQGYKVDTIDFKQEVDRYFNTATPLYVNPRDGQSGTITTTSNEFGEEAFYPHETKAGVEFLCRTNAALLPVYTCKTQSMGTWNSQVKFGHFMQNTLLLVPLSVSGANYAAGVYFQTSDSNGGCAAWKAVNHN